MSRRRGSGFAGRCVAVAAVMACGTLLQAQDQQHGKTERFFQITAGLGVSAHADPSMVNYINQVARPPPDQKLSQFASASEFFITPELQVSEDWSVGIEYSYFLKSYTSVGGTYQWDFSYSTQMPTFLVHYLTPGDGYWLKFGGGVGYAFGDFNERFLFTGASEEYRSSGPSFKIEAVGNTEFDPHFWGSIGVDLRWVFAGKLNTAAVRSVTPPSLNFFSAGVKFGVTFQLWGSAR